MQFLENFVGLIGRRAARDEKPRQCRARFGESLQKAVMRGHDAAGRRARRNESRPGAALPLSDQTPGGQKVRVASMRRKGPPAAALIHFLSNQNRHGLSTDRETGTTGASRTLNT